MNYYKRHLGDYAKKTRTLTVLQHGIYNLLLDLYYSEEAPVTTADAYAVCLARTAKDRAAVDVVLAKFFARDGDLWRNPKADEVIGKYHAKAPKAVESGRLGGIAKAQRNASETLDERQPNADISQKPELSNQEKEQRPRKRGSRLPKPFEITPEWIRDAQRLEAEAGAPLALKLETEFAKFCDYWWGVSGQKGVKNDWPGTWRNWIRNAIEWSGKNGSQTNRRNPSLAERAAEAERSADEILGHL